MPLPTSRTPGYTSYAGKVACTCLAQWLPLFRRLCVLRGYGDIRIWQLTGGATASAGTHSQGGVFDFAGVDTRKVALAREMGGLATWPRNWSGNVHTHGVLSGCPHNSPARYQIAAWWLGRDGTGFRGLVGSDKWYRPKTRRDYRQGMTWARAEIARLEGKAAPATPAPKPVAPKPAPKPLSLMERIMSNELVNPATKKPAGADTGLNSIWAYVWQQDARLKAMEATLAAILREVKASK